MSISYEGVAEQVVTMKLDTTGTAAKEGDLVSLAANNTVKVCPVSATPVGLVLGVKGDLAAVQVAGYMRLPCASDLAVGCAPAGPGFQREAGRGHHGPPGHCHGCGHCRRNLRRYLLLRKGGMGYGRI